VFSYWSEKRAVERKNISVHKAHKLQAGKHGTQLKYAQARIIEKILHKTNKLSNDRIMPFTTYMGQCSKLHVNKLPLNE